VDTSRGRGAGQRTDPSQKSVLVPIGESKVRLASLVDGNLPSDEQELVEVAPQEGRRAVRAASNARRVARRSPARNSVRAEVVGRSTTSSSETGVL